MRQTPHRAPPVHDRNVLRSRTFQPVVSSVICLIVMGCNTSTSPAAPVPGRVAFTTIVQGAAPGGRNARSSLHVVRTRAQHAALAARISSMQRPKLNGVDLSKNVLIAAFQGLRPTSGYKIEIVAVEISGKVLRVRVKWSSPTPGEYVRTGFETPYHLVQIARRDFDRYRLATYRLLDTRGNVLSEGAIAP